MSTTASVRVVFDTEHDPPEPIGTYAGTVEDSVCYFAPRGQRVNYAPQDCVRVVLVDVWPVAGCVVCDGIGCEHCPAVRA
jgi:hypothetical protein